MKIKLNHCKELGDWYTIVRAEHDGKAWFEPCGTSGNSFSFMSNERLTPDACIEGYASEMLSIAYAIRARSSESFKRCAVRTDDKYAYFISPRNGENECAIPLADADEFAESVLDQLEIDEVDDEG